MKKNRKKGIEPRNINDEFLMASTTGNVAAARYCLLSPELLIPDENGVIVGHADLSHDDDTALVNACFNVSFADNQEFSLLRYLLSSPELIQNNIPFANIHAQEDYCIVHACGNNNVELVKYLLTSPELLLPGINGKVVGHANIHARDDACFKQICMYEYTELLNFLVLDYKIENTPEIENYLNTTKDRAAIYAKKLFTARDLSGKLHNELNDVLSMNNTSKSYKFKV